MKARGSFLSLIAYLFQNQDSLCNDRVREQETKCQLFGLMCRCHCLWSFVGSLWSFGGCLYSFAGGLQLFAGCLWSFAGGLWSFVLVCGHYLF